MGAVKPWARTGAVGPGHRQQRARTSQLARAGVDKDIVQKGVAVQRPLWQAIGSEAGAKLLPLRPIEGEKVVPRDRGAG